MLEGFLESQSLRLGIDPTAFHFQQDGATAHTARNSTAVREIFGTVICRFGDITWPSRSPDLTVPDFFLWVFLKDRVFQRRVMTIQELKQAIVDEVAAIGKDLRRRVYSNFQTRLQQCIDVKRRPSA